MRFLRFVLSRLLFGVLFVIATPIALGLRASDRPVSRDDVLLPFARSIGAALVALIGGLLCGGVLDQYTELGPATNQPPLKIRVIGAVPFSAKKVPYLPKPLWESQRTLHALEPYPATFHYVEVAPGAKSPRPPKPLTLKQAIRLCNGEDAGK
jgi:hypothetical protein